MGVFLDDKLNEGEREKQMLPAAKPVISVVIPAFNEERNIAGIITQTEEALQAFNLPYEVIVVDDGSKDNTRHCASKSPTNKLLHESRQRLRRQNGTSKGKRSNLGYTRR